MTVTLGDIKRRALHRADMSLGFISDSALTDDIREGIQELHEILTGAYEDYDLVRDNITFTSGTQSYDLPPDFYKLRKAFRLEGTNDRREIFKFSLDDLSDDAAIFSARGDEFRYRILSDQIWLNPPPTGGGTIEIWYVPHKALPEMDHNVIKFQAPTGWEDFLVYDAAAKMLMREESDASMMVNEKERARVRITQSVQQRDNEPDQIRDVRSRFDHAFFDRLDRSGW